MAAVENAQPLGNKQQRSKLLGQILVETMAAKLRVVKRKLEISKNMTSVFATAVLAAVVAIGNHRNSTCFIEISSY
jgi:hypothetical protein